MRHHKNTTRHALLGLSALLLVSTAPLAAWAQSSSDAESQLLIAILVKKGVLSHSEGESIIQEARSEAAAARATTAQASAAPPAAPPVAPVPNEVATTGADGTIHVTYIPPIVRQQIAQQVETQVMAAEQHKGYASPAEIPDWINHVRIFGDLRTRYESNVFPSGNDNTGGLVNFNGINTGAPFDVSQANQNFPPQLNTDRNRNRFRIRVRLGVAVDIGGGFTAEIRLATGESDSPVSENQTLGVANNGQGGNFSKYAIYLDRAFIAYKAPLGDDADFSVQFGRFDNPFFSTNLIWADDLGFDGIVATGDYKFDDGLTPFLTAGAFPVFNTDFNFSSNQPAKFPSRDKYLFAVQAGASYKLNDDYSGKFAIADYSYSNIAGKLSAPCTVLSAADSCSTDDDRTAFAQNGNTYTALRDIIPTAANLNGTINQYQYFGLASNFNELALTGEVDFSNFDPTHLWVNGEYVKNLAFNKTDVGNKAVNNRAGVATATASAAAGTVGTYAGGDTGYFAYASIGQKVLAKRWDWNVTLGYKYVESDAVVDGLDDSDFGLGGTNLKGYIIAGQVALTHDVWVRLRYLSANSIAGPTYNNDTVQLDLNAKF